MRMGWIRRRTSRIFQKRKKMRILMRIDRDVSEREEEVEIRKKEKRIIRKLDRNLY
jgi:hypothetical protein